MPAPPMLRCNALPRADARQTPPDILLRFQLLIAPLVPILQGMTQQGRKSEVLQRERKELREAMVPDAPELTFTPLGDPDPRLVQLARLLGQQLARQNFEAQMNKRGSNGS